MSQQINLINPLLLKKRYAFGLREMAFGAGFALVVALAWTAWLHARAAADETRAAAREAGQAAAQQAFDAQAAAAARPASKLVTERARAIEAQVAAREALRASLGATPGTVSSGFAARLRALAHGRVDGVWLNGFTLAPGHVALNGSALEARLLSAYLDQLGRQAPFAGMRFSAMQAAPAQAQTSAPGQVDFTLVAGVPAKVATEAGDER